MLKRVMVYVVWRQGAGENPTVCREWNKGMDIREERRAEEDGGGERKSGREGWFALGIDTLSTSYILLAFPVKTKTSTVKSNYIYNNQTDGQVTTLWIKKVNGYPQK